MQTASRVFSLLILHAFIYSYSFFRKRTPVRRSIVLSPSGGLLHQVDSVEKCLEAHKGCQLHMHLDRDVASSTKFIGKQGYNLLSQSIALNKDIVKTFQNITVSDQGLIRLQTRVKNNLHVVSQVNVVTLMHRCRKASIDVLEFIPMEKIVDSLSVETGVLSGQGLANAFYSLHGLTGESRIVACLLPVLIAQIRRCRDVLNGQHTSLILYGLRSFTPQQSLPVLEALENLISESHFAVMNSKLNLKDISMTMPSESLACAFLGLQSLSAEIPIVERFLSFLCNSMDTSSRFYPRTVSNILLGLRSSPARNTAVQRILHKLSTRMKDKKLIDQFSLKEAGVASSGLHRMDAGIPEVLALRESLASITQAKAIEAFSCIDDVTNALKSMDGLTGKNQVVKDSLRRIHEQLSSEKGWLESNITETSLASCLFSMQAMSDSVPEVEVILSLFADALDMESMRLGDSVRWSSLSVSRALFGLQSMQGSLSLSRIIQHLTHRIDSSEDAIFASSEIGYALFGLRSLKMEEMSLEGKNIVLNFLSALLPKIRYVEDAMSLSDLALAFFGLYNMSIDSGRIVDDVARSLAEALSMCYSLEYEGLVGKAVSSQDVIMILRGISSLGPNFYFSESGMKVMRIISCLLDNHSPQLTNVQISTALRSLHSIAKMDVLPTDRVAEVSLLSFQGSGPIMAKPPNLPPLARQLIYSIYLHLLRRQEPLNGEQLSFALYGLQNCSPSLDVVWKVIRELTADLSVPNRDWSWDAHRIASALLGLKCMFSKQIRVRKLVSVLTNVVKTSNATLNAQAIGNAFYGLQNLQNLHPETRGLLAALNEKLRASPRTKSLEGLEGANLELAKLHNVQYELTDQNIGNALWGFKKMQADGSDPQEYHEVLESLELLAERIDESTAQMSPRHIANGLYAMQHMNPKHPQVQKLLFVLSTKIQLCSQPFTGLDLGMALFGLRLMDSSIMEVRLILLLLLQKANFSHMKLTEPELNMSIMGLVNATPWLRDWFLKVIAEKHPGMKLVD